MLDWLKELIASRYIKSVVRHVFTVLAGFLLSTGVDPAVVEKFVESGTAVAVAVLLWLVTQGWSWMEKRKD